MNFLRKAFSLNSLQLQRRDHGTINTFARAAEQIFERVRKTREEASSYEPSKLIVVERIVTLNGRPYWEKKIAEHLGLISSKIEKQSCIRKKEGTFVVVPNTPHVCKLLWRIKHLVRIKPVSFPDGLPKPGEFHGTHLNRFGEFRIDQSLYVEPSRVLPDAKFEKVKFDGREIAKPMHLTWMNGL